MGRKRKYIYHKIIVHTEYKEGTSNKYNPFIEKKKNLGYLILNISLCYIFCLNGYVYSQYYRLLPKNHIKNFGIYLYNLNNKEEIFALNPHKSFIPASNLKLLLLGAFLQNSDININLCNKFYITENNNFIEINIYGGGAFNFDHKNYSKEFEMFLNKNKNILANKIIKKINLDSSMFDSKTKNIYWNEHDKLEWWLPTVSPFILNSNLLNLKISYKKGRLTTKQLPFEFLDNIDISSIYCARKCNLNLLKAEYTTPTSVKLSGPICCNNTIIKQIPVESPVLYYTKALINYLQNNDIHFSGETTFKKIDNQNNPNFEYCSSLKELFQHLLKSSDNLVAETLLKYLGYIKYHEGSFDKGSLAIFEFVKSLGINEETSIYDGAGISRLNKVSPYALVKTLEFIYEKLGNDIYRMLPKGGEKNTTLRGRFKKFPAIVYAKTGFINDVFALTGIVKKGRTNYLFSILYNGKLKKWSAYSIQEKILKEMIKN